ncbi:MAG: hypothetical protein JNG88_00100 [Phycisphaerales bacterium]|nr:hypothetical protein [Phycisphaerales bacterium]
MFGRSPTARAEKKRRRKRRAPLILAVAALLLTLAAFIGYRLLTDPTRLRSMVVFALQSVGIQQPAIGTVEFALPAEIVLSHLELSSTDARQLGLPVDYADMQVALRIDGARLAFAWSDLFAGRVWPQRATVESAVMRIERRDALSPDTPNARDSSVPREGSGESTTAPRRPSFPADRLPEIHIRDLDVQLVETLSNASHLISRWRGRVSGEPSASGETGAAPAYTFRVTDHAEIHQEDNTEFERFSIQLLRGGFDASLTGLQLNTIAFLLPEAAVDLLRRVDLHGSLAIENVAVRNSRIESVTARLSNVDFCLPLESDTPLADRVFPLTNILMKVTVSSGPTRSGAITIDGRMRGAPLHGEVRLSAAAAPTTGAPASPGNELLAYSASIGIEDIVIPPHTEVPDLFRHPDLPRAARNFILDYEPSGRFRLAFDLSGRATLHEHGVEFHEIDMFSGVIEPRGARAMYAEFPYPLDDVYGALHIVNGGFDLDGITGMHGGARFRLDGHVDHSGPWTGLALRIRGDSVAMNQDLYAALPLGYRKLWAGASPVGLADVFATVSRPDGQTQNRPFPLDVHIETRWLNAGFNADAGLRLTDADGLITIGDELIIHDLYGYDGGASVRVSGGVSSRSKGGRDAAELRIEAHDMPLRRDASIIAGGDAGDESREPLKFTGVADVWGVSRNGADGRPTERYVAHVKDGVLQTGADACEWPGVNGWVVSDEQHLRILNIEGGDEHRHVSGEADIPLTGGAMRVRLDALDEDISQFLSCVAPPAMAPAANLLKLTGPGAISLAWDSVAGRDVLGVYAEVGAAWPPALPFKLSDLRGRLHTDGNSVQLEEVIARVGPQGTFFAAGGGWWSEGARDLVFEFGVKQLPIDAKLWAFITGSKPGPPSVQPKFAGDLEASITARIGESIDCDGEISVRDLRADVGLLLENCDGYFAGSAFLPPHRPAEFDLEFEFAVGRLAGRAIRDWRGRISRTAGPVRIHDVQGVICGGALAGALEYDPDVNRYELTVSLKGANADEFQQKPATPASKGRLDASLTLRGIGANDDSRIGAGDLRIYDTSFVKVPVLADLLESLRLRSDVDETLDFAQLHFAWEGRVLRLTDVEIHGRDIRLVGEGLWNIDTDRVELLLVGANPRNWPRIAVLSDVVELAGSELVQYRVSGTVQKPEIVPEPLHRLTDPIRRLIARSQR